MISIETKRFYNKISNSWYNIRHWSLFREELEELNKKWDNGKLLNIGCAQGADFLPFDAERFRFYGTDISKELLKLGKEYSDKFDKVFTLFTSNMKDLPLKDCSMDYIITIAALHHLLDRSERIKALEEIRRVLVKDGECLITVWNRWNSDFILKGKTIKKEWNYRGKILHRHYYLYTYRELEKDLKKAGLKILDLYPESNYRLPLKYFSRNILALVKK